LRARPQQTARTEVAVMVCMVNGVWRASLE
jgi:hypothetical protein